MNENEEKLLDDWTIVQTKRTKKLKNTTTNDYIKNKPILVKSRKKSKYSGGYKNKNKYIPKNKYTFLEKLRYKLSTSNLSIHEEQSLILKIKELEIKDDISTNQEDSDENLNNKLCNFCKNLGKTNFKGHIAKNCTILNNYQCTKCGDQGHTRKYCKNNYKPRCHYCKEFGHIIKMCPILGKNDNDFTTNNDLEVRVSQLETIIVE